MRWAPPKTVSHGLASRLVLQLNDALGGICLGEIWVEGVGLVRLLGKRFQVGGLRARHGLAPRDPVVGVLDLVRWASAIRVHLGVVGMRIVTFGLGHGTSRS